MCQPGGRGWLRCSLRRARCSPRFPRLLTRPRRTGVSADDRLGSRARAERPQELRRPRRDRRQRCTGQLPRGRTPCGGLVRHRATVPRLAAQRPARNVLRAIVPTRGTYMFHIIGAIAGQSIDTTATCSDHTFDCVTRHRHSCRPKIPRSANSRTGLTGRSPDSKAPDRTRRPLVCSPLPRSRWGCSRSSPRSASACGGDESALDMTKRWRALLLLTLVSGIWMAGGNRRPPPMPLSSPQTPSAAWYSTTRTEGGATVVLGNTRAVAVLDRGHRLDRRSLRHRRTDAGRRRPTGRSK